MHTFAQRPKSTQQTTSAKSTISGRVHLGQSREVGPILRLQRTIGNQAVQRLLQPKTEDLEASTASNTSTGFAHDFSRIPVYGGARSNIQPKLKANAPRDQYEQEADRLAEQVRQIPEPQVQRQLEEDEGLQMKANPSVLQRQEMEAEELLQGKFESVQRQSPGEEEDVLQGKFTTSETPAQLQGDVGEAANRTGMPGRLKAGLEALSGMDLSGIRVHSNSSKPARLNALAYTQEQDIYVGPGQDKHLPHEGWHAVQQMQGRVKPTMQAKGVSINDDARLEREADVEGAKALQKMHVSQNSSNAKVPDCFARSLEQVRVGTDGPAHESASSLHARPYTVGSHLYFGMGEYAPDTPEVRRLLDDELTHVRQQTTAGASGSQALPTTPIVQRQSLGGPAPAFDWDKKVNAAKQLGKTAAAAVIYKDLIVRAAMNVAVKAPLTQRVPTAADIRWKWTQSSQYPHGAETDAKRIDNDPTDYWKWIDFMEGAVTLKGQVWTESLILHELDHAAHGKAVYDEWVAVGSGGTWDAYWIAHHKKWKEQAITPEKGGVVGALAGLPDKIEPSAIEFRAYTNTLIKYFHRFERAQHGYLARAVVLFYPLTTQSVTEGASDSAMDLERTVRSLNGYFLMRRGVDPGQKANVKILLAFEFKNALELFRPSADRVQMRLDFDTILNFQYTSQEKEEANDNYKPTP